MKTSKTIILIAALLMTLHGFTQDTTKKDVAKTPCTISNEIGINTTLLLKQILSLSNISYETLPYDLTYKLIFKHSAIRAGVGFDLNNVQSKTTENSNQSSTPGPDQVVPNITNSSTIYYRVGWEHRFDFGKRFIVSLGGDFVGEYSNSSSQSCSSNNNLPDNYYFSVNKNKSTANFYGAGPEVGIQFVLTKHLSLYTEVPLYFQYSIEKSGYDNYSDNWEADQNTGIYSFVATDNKMSSTSKQKTFQLILPVTLYLAIKF